MRPQERSKGRENEHENKIKEGNVQQGDIRVMWRKRKKRN